LSNKALNARRELTPRGIITSFAECTKSRLQVIIIYTFPAFINLLIVTKSFPNIYEALKLFLAVSFSSLAVYFYNDIEDLENDLRNKMLGNPIPASRPLGSGKTTKNMMLAFVIISAIIGLVSAILINVQVFTSQIIYLILGYLYSTEPIKLKKRFMFKQLTVGLGVSFSGLSGALTGGAILPINLLWIVTTIMITLSGVGLGDIRDMRGDREMGYKTLPIVLGPLNTVRFSIATSIAIILSSYVGYLRLNVNLAYPILMTIIMSAWVYTAYPLIKNWQDSVYVDEVMFKKMIPIIATIFHTVPLIGVLYV